MAEQHPNPRTRKTNPPPNARPLKGEKSTRDLGEAVSSRSETKKSQGRWKVVLATVSVLAVTVLLLIVALFILDTRVLNESRNWTSTDDVADFISQETGYECMNEPMDELGIGSCDGHFDGLEYIYAVGDEPANDLLAEAILWSSPSEMTLVAPRIAGNGDSKWAIACSSKEDASALRAKETCEDFALELWSSVITSSGDNDLFDLSEYLSYRMEDETEFSTRSIGNGVHIVGSDIEPGRYLAEDKGSFCKWERVIDPSDSRSDPVSGGQSQLGGLSRDSVKIKPTDSAFITHGCGTWRKVP